VVLIGWADGIAQVLPVQWTQQAQGQVNGRDAAHVIFIVHPADCAVKAFSVALADCGNQLVIGWLSAQH
jgi:hypothetical protein